MVARRKRLAIHASDFVFLIMFWIVDYAIDAGAWAFLPRFEYVASTGIGHKLRNSLSEGRPTLYHRFLQTFDMSEQRHRTRMAGREGGRCTEGGIAQWSPMPEGKQELQD